MMKQVRKCGTTPRRQRRRGAALVEFAFVGNLLFFFVFVCFEFSRVGMVRNLAQDAAYSAAREAMVPGATKEEAETEAHRMMGALLNNGYTVTVNEISQPTKEINVLITVNFDEVALFIPMFMSNKTITANAKIRSERYGGYFSL